MPQGHAKNSQCIESVWKSALLSGGNLAESCRLWLTGFELCINILVVRSIPCCGCCSDDALVINMPTLKVKVKKAVAQATFLAFTGTGLGRAFNLRTWFSEIVPMYLIAHKGAPAASVRWRIFDTIQIPWIFCIESAFKRYICHNYVLQVSGGPKLDGCCLAGGSSQHIFTVKMAP